MEREKVKKKEKGKEPEKIREKEKEKRKEVEKKIEKEKEKGKEKGKKEKSRSKEEMRKEWETEKEKKQLKEEKKEKDNNVLTKHLLELPVRDHQGLGPLPKAIVWCSGPSADSVMPRSQPTREGIGPRLGAFIVDGRGCEEL